MKTITITMTEEVYTALVATVDGGDVPAALKGFMLARVEGKRNADATASIDSGIATKKSEILTKDTEISTLIASQKTARATSSAAAATEVAAVNIGVA
jgi:hypothetical protein